MSQSKWHNPDWRCGGEEPVVRVFRTERCPDAGAVPWLLSAAGLRQPGLEVRGAIGLKNLQLYGATTEGWELTTG